MWHGFESLIMDPMLLRRHSCVFEQFEVWRHVSPRLLERVCTYLTGARPVYTMSKVPKLPLDHAISLSMSCKIVLSGVQRISRYHCC